jgi:hypothetical protein
MLTAVRSHVAGRELAALGRGDGLSPLPDQGNVTATAQRREADACSRPAMPGGGMRERPRRARSRIPAREVAGVGI